LTIQSKYVVGCDGASSPVRKSQQLPFEGGTYENEFFVIDATIDWDLPYDKVVLCPSDKILTVFFPFLGDRKMRIIGTLPKQFNDQERLDFEVLEQTIIKKTKLKMDIVEVGWHSIYKLHHRCVNNFRSGNVFLAGDAAHIHSPAGGQGMNTGLQDAHNLAWKMAIVLKGTALPELLNTYNEERLPFARSLLQSTDRGFTIIASEGFVVRNIRKYLMIPMMSRLMKNLKFRKFVFQRVAQIKYNYRKNSLRVHKTKQSLKFKAGDRVPYVCKAFYTKFSCPISHLICFTQGQNPISPSAVKKSFPFEVKVIVEPLTDDWRRFGVTKELYILARPDQHVLAITDQLANFEGTIRLFNT